MEQTGLNHQQTPNFAMKLLSHSLLPSGHPALDEQKGSASSDDPCVAGSGQAVLYLCSSEVLFGLCYMS